MKAVSSVIVLLLLLVIIILLVGFVAVFLTGTALRTQNATENATQEALTGLSTSYRIVGIYGDKLLFQNTGENEIANDTLALFINGEPINTALAKNISSDEVVPINITGVVPKGEYDITFITRGPTLRQKITAQEANLLKNGKFGDSREKADIMIVIDTSTSMHDDCGPDKVPQPGETPCKINDAKTAANLFIDYAEPGDRIGLVRFSATASLNHELSGDFASVKNAVNALTLTTGTAMGYGIETAMQELNAKDRGLEKVQVVLTDGDTYIPYANHPVEMAEDARDINIVIYTIGLGSDVQNNVPLQVAQITGGQYFYAPTGEDLASIYSDLAFNILAAGWQKTGDVAIADYGTNCFSDSACARFTSDTGTLYQDMNIIISGTFDVNEASAMAFIGGPACAGTPGARTDDIRIRVLSYDKSGTLLGETVGPWGATSDTKQWTKVTAEWTTPANTKKVRVQIETSSCSTDIYLDDAYTGMSLK